MMPQKWTKQLKIETNRRAESEQESQRTGLHPPTSHDSRHQVMRHKDIDEGIHRQNNLKTIFQQNLPSQLRM